MSVRAFPHRDFSAKPFNTIEATAIAMAKACSDAKLGLAVVFSDSGEAANMVTKYRPTVPLVVVSSQPPTITQREVYFGQVRLASCAKPLPGLAQSRDRHQNVGAVHARHSR